MLPLRLWKRGISVFWSLSWLGDSQLSSSFNVGPPNIHELGFDSRISCLVSIPSLPVCKVKHRHLLMKDTGNCVRNACTRFLKKGGPTMATSQKWGHLRQKGRCLVQKWPSSISLRHRKCLSCLSRSGICFLARMQSTWSRSKSVSPDRVQEPVSSH